MKEFYHHVLNVIMKKKTLTEDEKMINRIRMALGELSDARNRFDMVVGSDNVELAILEINTAEKRYQNLIKEAKSMGITRASSRYAGHLAAPAINYE